ncbi:hypothetical protein HN011_004233 [Eciton burchellii]|nr:hypothetical protein HN011_004233 [Eciton burchellii]
MYLDAPTTRSTRVSFDLVPSPSNSTDCDTERPPPPPPPPKKKKKKKKKLPILEKKKKIPYEHCLVCCMWIALAALATVGAQVVPQNAHCVVYTDSCGQLLDTLPVCQDFNRQVCNRPACKFIHLSDGNVEVIENRVTVCRDAVKGACMRPQSTLTRAGIAWGSEEEDSIKLARTGISGGSCRDRLGDIGVASARCDGEQGDEAGREEGGRAPLRGASSFLSTDSIWCSNGTERFGTGDRGGWKVGRRSVNETDRVAARMTRSSNRYGHSELVNKVFPNVVSSSFDLYLASYIVPYRVARKANLERCSRVHLSRIEREVPAVEQRRRFVPAGKRQTEIRRGPFFLRSSELANNEPRFSVVRASTTFSLARRSHTQSRASFPISVDDR